MSIQISGNTVIDDSRKGIFQKVHSGSYSSPPSGASEGDMIYDTTEKTIKVYTGSEWV